MAAYRLSIGSPQVHKGTLKVKKSGKKVDVAIKLAKLDVVTKEQIKEIMREVRLLIRVFWSFGPQNSRIL